MNHKDGCTAICPNFIARTAYKGKNIINCRACDSVFRLRDERDKHYRDFCCTSRYYVCEAIKESQEKHI